jgi:uncharacterized protein (TIGR02001 family)
VLKTKLAAAFIAAALFSPFIIADVDGSIGVSSDYFWRGTSQNAGNTALSAGLDFEKSGFYASVWGSQVDFGDTAEWEYDLIGGYDLKLTDDFSIGGGVIQYNYDKGYDDVEEVFVNTVYKNTNIKYYVDTDNRDNAYLDVRQGLSFVKPVDVSIEYGSFKGGDSHIALHVGKLLGKVYANLMVMDGVRHGNASDMVALSLIYNFK